MESITTSLTGNLAITGWIVLGLYLVLMIAIGVYCNKRFTNSLNGFLLGGRSLGPWIFALTYGSTYVSTAAFIGNAGSGYKSGMAYMLMPVPQILLIPLGMLIVAPRLRVLSQRLNVMTIPQMLGGRYKSTYMQFVGSVVILICIIPMMVSVTKGGALAVAQLLNLSYGVSVFLVSGVALAYLVFGGFMARVYTDLVQGSVMFIGMLLIVIFGLWSFGGVSGLADKLATVDTRLLETPGPTGWHDLLLFSSVFALTPWGSPQYVQTIFTINKKRSIYASAVLLSIWFGLLLVGPIVVGNMSRATFGNAFIDNVDKAFPAFTLHMFPNIIGALIIVAAIAAAMSSIDGILMTIGSAFGVDLYRRFFKKDATDKQTIMATNVMMIVAEVIVVIWALYPPDMLLYLNAVSHSIVGSSFLIPVFMAVRNKKATTAAGVASMTAGIATCLVWYFGAATVNGPYWFNMPPFVMAAIVATVVFLLVQRVTKPMDPAFVNDLFSKEAEEAAYVPEEV